MNTNLQELLKSFNQNQLNEINKFLNSSVGKNMKLTGADKEKLMNELGKINPEEARKKIGNLSASDIIKIMKNL